MIPQPRPIIHRPAPKGTPFPRPCGGRVGDGGLARLGPLLSEKGRSVARFSGRLDATGAGLVALDGAALRLGLARLRLVNSSVQDASRAQAGASTNTILVPCRAGISRDMPDHATPDHLAPGGHRGCCLRCWCAIPRPCSGGARSSSSWRRTCHPSQGRP